MSIEQEREASQNCYQVPVDGIQARYRLSDGRWSTWGHVITGEKGQEVELRAVNFYPDRRACTHPSWEDCGNGKWRCACCNVIGDERRYLQPDGELDRVYDRAALDQRQGGVVTEEMVDVADDAWTDVYDGVSHNHREAMRAALQSIAQPVRVPEWTWNWLMDYCRENGASPANHNKLFKLVSDMRAMLSAAPAYNGKKEG